MSPNISPNMWFETCEQKVPVQSKDAAEHAQRYIDETKEMFGELFVGVVKQIQPFTQQRKTKFVLDLDQTSSTTAKQMLLDQTR